MIIDARGYRFELTPWVGRAACRGCDPDLFFPTQGGSSDNAKAVCATCPTRTECLDYALRWDINHGVWGGLSPRERRRIGRVGGPRRVAAAHETTTRYARGCRCDGCTEANTLDRQLRVERVG